jgi:hypothetical protein
MTSRTELLPVSLPPRLLARDEAAAYCGMSSNHFDKHCPIGALQFGARRLWDVRALDRWVDRLSGLDQPSRSQRLKLAELLSDGDQSERR